MKHKFEMNVPYLIPYLYEYRNGGKDVITVRVRYSTRTVRVYPSIP